MIHSGFFYSHTFHLAIYEKGGPVLPWGKTSHQNTE